MRATKSRICVMFLLGTVFMLGATPSVAFGNGDNDLTIHRLSVHPSEYQDSSINTCHVYIVDDVWNDTLGWQSLDRGVYCCDPYMVKVWGEIHYHNEGPSVQRICKVNVYYGQFCRKCGAIWQVSYFMYYYEHNKW